MASEIAVSVTGLSKVFRIPFERRNRLREHMVHLFRSPGYRRLEALNDVSLEIRRGEFFGIIGRNGGGKSTLLKILAGIYQPTQGKVKISGRLSPFIELGVGFNPELTARDNVFLNGAILGLDRKQVAAQFDNIIGFAELEDFVDQKVKNFSSGMLVRLAFSVAIRAHADILLIDEVLAVGDFEFQQKCFNVFRQLKAEEKTIIFVSHDLTSINEFSDRVLILDRGIAHGVYAPEKAISEYHRLIEARVDASTAGDGQAAAGAPHGRNELPTVRAVAMFSKGTHTHEVHRGDEATVLVTVGNPRRMPINVGVAIYRSDGLYCFGTNTFISETPPPLDEQVAIEVRFSEVGLLRGNYYLLVGIFGDKEKTVYEMRNHAYEFQVDQQDGYEGAVYLPHSWHIRS
jgi:ABC-type polysaccharide/polyol phosphate transport system ATPase subunit